MHQGDLVTYRKTLRHGAIGFTFSPKEAVRRILIALENLSLSVGFDPANLGSGVRRDNHYSTENEYLRPYCLHRRGSPVKRRSTAMRLISARTLSHTVRYFILFNISRVILNLKGFFSLTV
jgi:hypothetical protein